MSKKWFEAFPVPDTAAWMEAIKKSVKDPAELEKLTWNTQEGFPLESFYRKADTPGITRENLPADNHWEIRQVIYTDKVMAANQSALKALENGAESIVFTGSDVPSEKELETLFRDIRLDWFPAHFQFGESNVAMLYMLLDHYRNQEYNTLEMHGSIYMDPLSELYISGNFEYSHEGTLEVLKAVFETVSKELPNYRFINVSGHLFREAGATAVHEVAYALSQWVEYLHLLTDQGFTATAIASHSQFHLGTGPDYFIEIGKLRAFRRLLQKIAAAYEADAGSVATNCISIQRNKTIYDPHTNLLRATSEGMASAIGGCTSITLPTYDETYRAPEEASYRIARNIQLIMREEAGLGKTVDAGAGSYYIETITDRIATEAWKLFLALEKQGGFIASLRKGTIQKEIETAAEAQKQAFMKGTIVSIGTNKYLNKDEQKSDVYNKHVSEPLMKESLTVKPIRTERLSERLELERIRLETARTAKDN